MIRLTEAPVGNQVKINFPHYNVTRSFIHRSEGRNTEGRVNWLFLSIRLSFTCSHQTAHPHQVCLICPFCLHTFALVSVWRCVYVCVLFVFKCPCVYVWLGQLIPLARKCPAARIWTWESVRCSVDMWQRAKSGTQPLSISMVQHCPFTVTALPKTGWECWEKVHIAKKKFKMLQRQPIAKNLSKIQQTIKTIIS